MRYVRICVSCTHVYIVIALGTLCAHVRMYIYTEEHSIHTCISVPIGECVLEEMSLWCLYPMYVPSNVHSHHVKSIVVVVVYRFQ